MSVLKIEVKMNFGTFLLLFFNLQFVVMRRHQQQEAQTVWTERCTSDMIALNDCNWCHCDRHAQYTCKSQDCRQVDMFGHFNDAIREMDVGMEGHGVWRSDDAHCEPGVHYQKMDLLCVCSEDGRWPNSFCRDSFQILHPVEKTEHAEPIENKTCNPTKLYLFDCNVCVCPASGQIDPKLCTKKECKGENVEPIHKTDIAEEVYATCIPNKKYKLGCQTCTCIRNNRLLCDNCTAQDELKRLTGQKSVCHLRTPGVSFKRGCNFCHCDQNGTIYCTAKNCLKHHAKISLPRLDYQHVEQVLDEQNCAPNTKYKKDCNTCHCFMIEGVKYFGCTQETCTLSTALKEDTTCVEGTSYQANCLVCHCVVHEGIKREYCTVDITCLNDKNIPPRSLSSMHGYCEPLHTYKQGCNTCRCLPDGKTVACTSKTCSKKKNKIHILKRKKAKFGATLQRKPAAVENPIIVEFVPFVQRGRFCFKGETYKVGCNICYCMNTGNAVCTTKKC